MRWPYRTKEGFVRQIISPAALVAVVPIRSWLPPHATRTQQLAELSEYMRCQQRLSAPCSRQVDISRLPSASGLACPVRSLKLPGGVTVTLGILVPSFMVRIHAR